MNDHDASGDLLQRHTRVRAASRVISPAEVLDAIAAAVDAINGVWAERFGRPLFRDVACRALVDLRKPCRTMDQLSNRLQSLGLLIDSIDVDCAKYAPNLSGPDRKPINMLERMLEVEAPDFVPNREIITTLRQIRRLRNLYPAHADPKESIQAVRSFGFAYPVTARQSPAFLHAVRVAFLHCLDLLRQAVAADKALPRLLMTAVQACHDDEWQRCLETSVAALQLGPNQAILHCLEGMARFHLGAHRRSIAAFAKAASLDPGDRLAVGGLGLMCCLAGWWRKATETLTDAIRLAPDNAILHYGLGRAYLETERYEKALPEFEAAVNISPDLGDAWTGIAVALLALDRHGEVMTAARRAVRLDANDAVAQACLGWAYARSGSTKRAVYCFRRAIRIKPDYFIAHWSLGCCCLEQGLYRDALDSFEAAVRIDPSDYSGHEGMGLAYSGLRQPHRALAAYRHAARLSPEMAELHARIGRACLDLGRHADAIRAYRKALRLQPASAQALADVGRAYLELGRWKAAATSLRKYVLMEPQSTLGYLGLGLAYAMSGQWERAWKQCQLLEAIDPSEASTLRRFLNKVQALA